MRSWPTRCLTTAAQSSPGLRRHLEARFAFPAEHGASRVRGSAVRAKRGEAKLDSGASSVELHCATRVVHQLTESSRKVKTDDSPIASPVNVIVQQVWYNHYRHDVRPLMYQTLVSTGEGVESSMLARKEEAMADRVGQQLGNYRLVRLLGRGGFAEVYLGHHLRLDTQAAIKVLYTRLATKDEVESFEQEARTIAHLKHPHIVRILDYDVQEDTPFLVMDYASGGTLRTRHPKGTRLPVAPMISYVKQIADALQYAHDRRIIHRDVKPDNMLLGEHHELLLSDFGIAIVAQSSRYQRTQNMGGTMAYMAPEQIQGHPRPASDQYSLGIVVYEWLSGQCPFHGSMTEIVAQHLMVPPPPLDEKVPTISPDVEQVVLVALAKDPKERFGSVQAFATALAQAYQPAPPHQVALPTQAPLVSDPSLPSETGAALFPP